MKDRHMSDRFLVMARFSVDDIPIMVCETFDEARAVATGIARDPAVLLTTYGGVFHALSIHHPDIVNLAAATVLRLQEGRIVDAVCWTIIPGEQEQTR